MAFSLLALGAGLVLNSVLGPLVVDAIDYPLSETLRNQLLGLDAVTLVLVAPLCVFAGALVLRDRPAGRVLALAPAAYTSYMFVQYIVGPTYERYPRVLALHLSLFVLSGFVALRAWSTLVPSDLPALDERRQRAWSLAVIALSLFVVARYLPVLVGSVTGEPLAEEFAADPAFFWAIVLLDLGVVVPVTIATAFVLRRGTPSANKALFAVVGWFALVPPSVAGMALAMVVNRDPHASVGSTAVLIIAAVVFAAFALRLYRPVLRRTPSP